MNFADFIGQTLDYKYKIERELGKGGMGTVYLATHVGTERPVAVKIIAPEFMQRQEFIERFRREARAAGRLRHPNVVNVTDFGFADTKAGKVAYLAMEYLDGCTLGEILEEEHRLPLAWTLDIIEQVCSAVHEAHKQGIIHRDLKPDNIWLEPNQRGGYTVKVLDFGIAKLEESFSLSPENPSIDVSIAPQRISAARATIADISNNDTLADNRHSTQLAESATMIHAPKANTILSEAGTLVQSGEVFSEDKTAIYEDKTAIFENETAIFNDDDQTVSGEQEDIGTKIIPAQIETKKPTGNNSTDGDASVSNAETKELTRVGAVLGTPLYMSPEQCRGEKLSAQSDIYSLGVIAYQMLAGKTPFSGDYLKVMEAHKEIAPPPLEVKKIPKKVKKVISSALSKSVEERPPSAQAFAAELRAESEGIGELFRRALVIYSEHLPKFLSLALILYSPVAIFTLLQLIVGFLAISDSINEFTKIGLKISITLFSTFFGIFCGYLVFGTTTWLVTQILSVPLRPVRLRPALAATRRRWKTFAGTGMLSAILTLMGYMLCFVPGMIFSVIWALVAPVVMMENLRGFAALKRSKTLVKRSLLTTMGMVFIMFFVPILLSAVIAFFANATVKSFSPDPPKPPPATVEIVKENSGEAEKGVSINLNGDKVKISDSDEPKDMRGRVRATVREALTEIFLLPVSILIGSFSSIVVALLYLKTRQVGGESMQDLLSQFEEADLPRTNWQRRVHERLEQSGKLTGSKSFTTKKSGSTVGN